MALPKEPRKLIEIGLTGVMAMQRSDGGFSYWPSGSKSSPFATAYALIVLHRVQLAAAQTKVTLPGDATGRALKYLRRQLAPKKGEKQRLVGELGYAQQAMAAYALALHGESAGPLLRRLTAKRHRSPLFVRAMLLAALAAQNKGAKDKSEVLQAALSAELTDSLKVDGTWAHAEENLHDGYQVLMHPTIAPRRWCSWPCSPRGPITRWCRGSCAGLSSGASRRASATTRRQRGR